MYNILVVEDDCNTNQVICEFLKDSGYTVTASFDGKAAIKHLLAVFLKRENSIALKAHQEQAKALCFPLLRDLM